MNMNFDQARFNMVEQQIRPWDVLDARVLEVFETVHREDFVPVRFRKLAFADLEIPLAQGQNMMRPKIEGRMLQAIGLKPDETVLEIGTGSGFVTACLSRLAKEVMSVDCHEEFLTEAKARLKDHACENVELLQGDVMRGWQPELAHDVVVVTGSVPAIPEIFRGWVNPGGRLFVICGESPAMQAMCLTRTGVSEWQEESLFETDLIRLVNSEQAAGFSF